MDDPIGTNIVTSISRRLILPELTANIYAPFRRLTPAEQAAQREQREAEWDEKMAAGMVPLSEGGDHCYECGGTTEWILMAVEQRGQVVTKWASADAWGVYLFAKHLMDVAEEGLDEH